MDSTSRLLRTGENTAASASPLPRTGEKTASMGVTVGCKADSVGKGGELWGEARNADKGSIGKDLETSAVPGREF